MKFEMAEIKIEKFEVADVIATSSVEEYPEDMTEMG